MYKASRWFYLRHIPFFPKILKGVNYLFHSCVVPYDCEIGEGSKFLYGGLGTVVVRNAKIGKHVLIGTNDNVIIGANAVVIHDVPSNCSVAGVPARIIKENINVNEYCSLGRY